MAMLSGVVRSLFLSIPKTLSSSPSPSPFFITCFRFSVPFTAPSSPTTPSAISQFLETDCAFSSPQISKIIKAEKSLMRVRSTQTARQVVEFLRERGFSHSQIHNTIIRYPSVLTRRVDRYLMPLFDFLTIFGFSNQNLRILISKNPRMLGNSLDGNIKPSIAFLEELFSSKASLIKCLVREPTLLVVSVEKQLKPKVDILKNWGIEGDLLSLLLSAYPKTFTRSSIQLLETRAEYVRNTIGIVKCSKTFVYAFGLFVGLGLQNLEKKVKHLESLGLQKEEVQQLLRKHPTLFTCSVDKMQRNMDFLTHTAGFQPNVVVSNSCLLGFSVENRLKPRFAVFQALCAMQKPTPNLLNILTLSEKIFLQKVMECSPHASILKEIYKRKVNSTDVETT